MDTEKISIQYGDNEYDLYSNNSKKMKCGKTKLENDIIVRTPQFYNQICECLSSKELNNKKLWQNGEDVYLYKGAASDEFNKNNLYAVKSEGGYRPRYATLFTDIFNPDDLNPQILDSSTTQENPAIFKFYLRDTLPYSYTFSDKNPIFITNNDATIDVDEIRGKQITVKVYNPHPDPGTTPEFNVNTKLLYRLYPLDVNYGEWEHILPAAARFEGQHISSIHTRDNPAILHFTVDQQHVADKVDIIIDTDLSSGATFESETNGNDTYIKIYDAAPSPDSSFRVKLCLKTEITPFIFLKTDDWETVGIKFINKPKNNTPLFLNGPKVGFDIELSEKDSTTNGVPGKIDTINSDDIDTINSDDNSYITKLVESGEVVYTPSSDYTHAHIELSYKHIDDDPTPGVNLVLRQVRKYPIIKNFENVVQVDGAMMDYYVDDAPKTIRVVPLNSNYSIPDSIDVQGLKQGKWSWENIVDNGLPIGILTIDPEALKDESTRIIIDIKGVPSLNIEETRVLFSGKRIEDEEVSNYVIFDEHNPSVVSGDSTILFYKINPNVEDYYIFKSGEVFVSGVTEFDFGPSDDSSHPNTEGWYKLQLYTPDLTQQSVKIALKLYGKYEIVLDESSDCELERIVGDEPIPKQNSYYIESESTNTFIVRPKESIKSTKPRVAIDDVILDVNPEMQLSIRKFENPSNNNEIQLQINNPLGDPTLGAALTITATASTPRLPKKGEIVWITTYKENSNRQIKKNPYLILEVKNEESDSNYNCNVVSLCGDDIYAGDMSGGSGPLYQQLIDKTQEWYDDEGGNLDEGFKSAIVEQDDHKIYSWREESADVLKTEYAPSWDKEDKDMWCYPHDTYFSGDDVIFVCRYDFPTETADPGEVFPLGLEDVLKFFNITSDASAGSTYLSDTRSAKIGWGTSSGWVPQLLTEQWLSGFYYNEFDEREENISLILDFQSGAGAWYFDGVDYYKSGYIHPSFIIDFKNSSLKWQYASSYESRFSFDEQYVTLDTWPSCAVVSGEQENITYSFEAKSGLRFRDSNGNALNDSVERSGGEWSVSEDGTTATAEFTNVMSDIDFNVRHGSNTTYESEDIEAGGPVWKKTLDECSWDDISKICDDGYANKIFKVGDTKKITLNSGVTIGDSSSGELLGYKVPDNGLEVCARIIGFNQTYGSVYYKDGFRELYTDRGSDCLSLYRYSINFMLFSFPQDSKIPNTSYGAEPGDWFSLTGNKYSNAGAIFADGGFTHAFDRDDKGIIKSGWPTNVGGWQKSDLRWRILGSSQERSKRTDGNYDYSTTGVVPNCLLPDQESLEDQDRPYIGDKIDGGNIKDNTLIRALPSELIKVLKPIVVYTDNTGGDSQKISDAKRKENVTPTIDYLPLPSEYEIFGKTVYANRYEKSRCVWYTYFRNYFYDEGLDFNQFYNQDGNRPQYWVDPVPQGRADTYKTWLRSPGMEQMTTDLSNKQLFCTATSAGGGGLNWWGRGGPGFNQSFHSLAIAPIFYV